MKNTFLLSCILFLLSSGAVQAQDKTGYVKFTFNVDSAYVLPMNDVDKAVKVASGDSLAFETGNSIFSVQTYFDKSGTFYIPVSKKNTFTYSYKFIKGTINPATITNNIAARYHYNANIIVVTDDDSDIYYNGSYKGTGFAKFNAQDEIAKINLRNPDFGNYTRTLNVGERRLTYVQHYRRPVKRMAQFISILPGASQAYKKQYLKSAAVGISSIALFTFAGIRNKKYNDERKLFFKYRKAYNNALTEEEAFRLGDLTQSQQSKVEKYDNQRRFLLLSGLLIYGFNIYDALTCSPKGGYANKEKDLNFYLSSEEISGIIGTTGTLRYNF